LNGDKRDSRSANGEGAEAAAEGCFDFAQEAVAAEGPAGLRTQSDQLITFGVGLADPIAPVGRRVRPVGQRDEAVRLLAAMQRGARPRVSPRLTAEASLDGIAFDVNHGLVQMRFVERAGEEAVLPQVPTAAVHAIDVLRVAEMRAADRLRQGLFAARRGDEMNVVRHEAVAVNPKADSLRLLGQQVKIDAIVVFHKEDSLTIIAPLRYVMRAIRYDHSCKSRHAPSLSSTLTEINT
jgi:hypothetical protein